ncbi:thioredoxin family protein [Aquimarina brevivitae]|uniref:Thiol-disulfide isomerase/thioredoxin n=1 Tax=Aquimarina brevivitae TaxID=323412 RepID=A0A4Q7NX71_9FLAO|nr:thioredoxin family protein [Aquimarina brevivitae]RZS91961.1 thiol-disulfide isomerase/thioredoxin [Aquimarina brevivitae]
MKKIGICIIFASLIACGSTSTATAPEANKTTPTKKSTSTSEKPDMLVGNQNREAFLQEPFTTWFTPNYDEYNPEEEVVNNLKPLLGDVKIKAFMGTWCGDSKRETPTFYKILDQADFDYTKLDLVTVDRTKTTPDGLEKGYDIQRVPTFIFYKNGEEIGRYVEYARESLEKDMLAILSGKDYKHSYED